MTAAQDLEERAVLSGSPLRIAAIVVVSAASLFVFIAVADARAMRSTVPWLVAPCWVCVLNVLAHRGPWWRRLLLGAVTTAVACVVAMFFGTCFLASKL